MQWKYIGGACFLLQNLWLWRDYLSTFRIFVILLMSSVIFFLNSNFFNRNIEEYKRELEQLLGFYLEIPANVEEDTSKNVVDEALTAMKLQLEAAKRERDSLHHQLIDTRQEIRKGETKITNITEKENIIEDNVIHPSSSSTCMFNARNKQLEKQLQAAELQMRQQAQALADADLRVQRAAEAEKKLDQVLKHVIFLEKEKKNAQRRFDHIQRMTNNLSSRLNEMESNYERTTRHAMKIQESMIKKRNVTAHMLNEAQREAREAKQELEYLRRNTSLVPYPTHGHQKKSSEESTTSQVSHQQKTKETKELTTIYSNRSDLNSNNKKQIKESNKSLPSIKPTENCQRKISEDGKFEGAGDRSLLGCENSTVSNKSTGPQLCSVDAASMVSLFSTSSLDKRDKEMDLIWHPINRCVLEESQRYLDPSPEFKHLLARLEDDGEL